jgi:flagellar motor protein MotB
MKDAVSARWAISFADLLLLLLGCFVFLHAIEAARPTARAAAAPGPAPRLAAVAVFDAAGLFEPGEARLTDAGRARIAAIAPGLRGGNVLVASRGLGEGGGRLDRFELAAARSVAVSRALRAAGLDERAIAVSFDEAAGRRGQRITVSRR